MSSRSTRSKAAKHGGSSISENGPHAAKQSRVETASNLPNPYLSSLEQDFLYHIGYSRPEIRELFNDVKVGTSVLVYSSLIVPVHVQLCVTDLYMYMYMYMYIHCTCIYVHIHSHSILLQAGIFVIIQIILMISIRLVMLHMYMYASLVPVSSWL